MNTLTNFISKSPYLRLAEFLIVSAFAIAGFLSYQADRRGRAQLSADLAAANHSLVQATARQHDRGTQLAQTLSAIANAKRTTTTPTQILRDLPNRVPLPVPITVAPPQPVGARGSRARVNPDCDHSDDPCSSGPNGGPEGLDSTAPLTNPVGAESPNRRESGEKSLPTATLPIADLKPLYDFTLDCQACQAKLAAAQSDLADERTKSATLTQERNEAIRVTKGGGTLRRLARAAKWFALGAAAGAAAASAHH